MEAFTIHEDNLIEFKENASKFLKKEKKTKIPKKLVEKRTVLKAFNNGVRQETKKMKIENKENMPPRNEKLNLKKEEKHKPEIDSDLLKIVPAEDDVQRKNVLNLSLSRTAFHSSEFSEDIWKYYKGIEMSSLPKPRYMDKQTHITWSMRSILVDWLVCVADEYNLCEETLYLAVNYIDRFLSKISVVREKVQLVGASAMLIAGKMEEIFPPMPNEWASLTDDTYTTRQILKMEQLLVKVLEFKLQPPTIYTFVRQFCMQYNMDEATTNLAMYLSELVLLEGNHYLNYKPSEIAAAAIIYSRYTLKKPVVWPRELEKSSGYTVKHLSPIVKAQSITLKDSPNKKQQTIQGKYKSPKFGRVALIKPVCVKLEYLEDSIVDSSLSVDPGEDKL